MPTLQSSAARASSALRPHGTARGRLQERPLPRPCCRQGRPPGRGWMLTWCLRGRPAAHSSHRRIAAARQPLPTEQLVPVLASGRAYGPAAAHPPRRRRVVGGAHRVALASVGAASGARLHLPASGRGAARLRGGLAKAMERGARLADAGAQAEVRRKAFWPACGPSVEIPCTFRPAGIRA